MARQLPRHLLWYRDRGESCIPRFHARELVHPKLVMLRTNWVASGPTSGTWESTNLCVHGILWRVLERDTRCKLQKAQRRSLLRRHGACNQPGVSLAIDAAVGIAVVHVIEEVECLHLQLHLDTFPKVEVLGE